MERSARAALAAEERLAKLRLFQLSRTWPDVEDELAALIEVHRRESASAAARFYESLRTAKGVSGEYVARLAPAYIGSIRPALRSTTLATAIRIGAKTSVGASQGAAVATTVAPLAAAGALVTATIGVTTRLVVNAGRDTIVDTADDDDQAVGYARVTGRGACSFCAMLASRGPIYKSERIALRTSSGHRYHDHCHCGVEPMFSRDEDWPGEGRAWQALWEQATADASSPDDARKTFRREVGAGLRP